jgi:hypothetical protein
MSISKAAAAAVVWSVSIAFAGAVIVLLRTPVVPAPAPEAPPMAARAPAVVEPTSALIELAPIVIVGDLPTRAPPPTPTAKEARCDEWRRLVQGDVSQRVRSCE